MDNYHLSPPADGWELGKAGVERASKRAATKQELVGSLADFFCRQNSGGENSRG